MRDVQKGSGEEFISVLIVEDETIPAHYLKNIIESEEGFVVVQIASDSEEALAAVRDSRPQVIFMDIMLRGSMSGAELAVTIRTHYPKILILFMTAYSNDEMMEYAVEADAFAYLLKPYRPREIHATLRLAAARLRKPAEDLVSPTVALVDGFVCHTDTHRLYRGEEEVLLSPSEAALIQILCKSHQTIVTTEVICHTLDIGDASLRSLIYRLRKSTSQRLVSSVKRAGYCLGKKDQD